MRPQFALILRRLIATVGPLLPVLLVLIVNGKRW
jgi:hypothetical protein